MTHGPRDAQCGPTHRRSGSDRIGGAPDLLKVPAGMARRWALEAAVLLCGFCSALLLISPLSFHLLSSWQLPQISILACLVQGICKVVHIKQARHEMLGFTFSFPCSGPWPDCAACLLASLVCLSVAKTAESACCSLRRDPESGLRRSIDIFHVLTVHDCDRKTLVRIPAKKKSPCSIRP